MHKMGKRQVAALTLGLLAGLIGPGQAPAQTPAPGTATSAQAQTLPSEELARRSVERRAIEAVIASANPLVVLPAR
jgi:hypothetical protein